MVGLILLSVSSFAAYSKFTEPQSRFGSGQTKAWIFGEPIYGYAIDTQPAINHEILLNQEELARYPTFKAYIDYLEYAQGITSHGASSIDPTEARSLLLFLSQKASFDVMSSVGISGGESYSLNIILHNPLSKVLPGSRYDISILFNDEPPMLD